MRRSSPTTGLLVGLVITLAAVLIDAWYMTRQISGLRVLQTDLADRNRKDSLQLLRIQNDLNSLALAMRDMLDSDGPYPLTAWSAQFERIRLDLTDALAREESVAVATRTPEQRQYLTASVSQFWDAVDRIFALAKAGKEQEARDEIRLSLQARQGALSTAVARLLVENNAAEEQTAGRVQDIYSQVQRQEYWFVGATLTTILLMSLYLIRSNRRLFAELASLSDQRREFARQLIETRESTLHEISRELHDEFGQLLTAMGLMIGRASRHVPDGSPLQAELHEIREIAQTTLDNVRGLSQTLHPSILEDAGLEGTIEWYLPTVERQTGLAVSYERSGPSRRDPQRDRDSRVPCAAGSAEQRRPSFGREPSVGPPAVRRRIAWSSKSRTTAPALPRQPGSAPDVCIQMDDDGAWAWSRCVSGRPLSVEQLSSRMCPDGGTLVRMTVPLPNRK